MIGHQQIIDARLDGLKPTTVFFTDAKPPAYPMPVEAPEKALEHRLYPEVYLSTDDLKKRLDLRFIASCRVLINTKTIKPELVKVAERAAECGATLVCLASPDEIILFKDGEWNAWTS